MNRITIVDVAKKAVITKGTVFNVINTENTIEPRTKNHVEEVMTEWNADKK